MFALSKDLAINLALHIRDLTDGCGCGCGVRGAGGFTRAAIVRMCDPCRREEPAVSIDQPLLSVSSSGLSPSWDWSGPLMWMRDAVCR
jgi:hypothetical protein